MITVSVCYQYPHDTVHGTGRAQSLLTGHENHADKAYTRDLERCPVMSSRIMGPGQVLTRDSDPLIPNIL